MSNMSGLTMIMSSERDTTCSFPSSMSASEIANRLNAMQTQESTTYRCNDYIGNDENHSFDRVSRPQNQHDQPVDQECRVKMCEWCYQVTDFCKFRRETVAIGMSYLDRFLSSSTVRARKAILERKEYQLAAMTCLYLAIKLFEPMAMDVSLLSAISHGCYSETDVVQMEQEILNSLKWMMNGPTAHDFLSHIIALMPPSIFEYDDSAVTSLFDFSKFQVEIAVSDYDCVLQKPSILALAAILNSAEGIDEDLLPAHIRFEFLRTIIDESKMDPFSYEVNAVRARLLELFAANSGYQLPQIANLTPLINTNQEVIPTNITNKILSESSPVSVARSLYQLKSSFAKSA